MALMINFESRHGLDSPLYWRLNNFEQIGNREPDGSIIPAIARFRAYLSEEAFKSGKGFLEEMLIQFTPSSSSANMAGEAYAALKQHDPTPEAAARLDDLENKLKGVDEQIAVIEAEIEHVKKADKQNQASLPHLTRMLAEILEHKSRVEDQIAAARKGYESAAGRRVAIQSAEDV